MKERLTKQLEAEISRRNIDLVTQFVLETPGAVDVLVEIILDDNEKVSHRAAWALEKVSEKLDSPVKKYLTALINSFDGFGHSGIRRCLAKVFMLHKIPEDLEGKVLDFCLTLIEEPKEPVGVKANCMAIVFNLLPKYPELKKEVFEIIEHQIPYNSAGFESRFEVLKRKMKQSLSNLPR